MGLRESAGGVQGSVRNLDEALAELASILDFCPAVERRGMRVHEIQGVTSVTIHRPLERLALNPARQLNPWVTLAEFPWLMAGRSDVGWLLPYLPRAADYADDGRYWRAGYGPRLRSWGRQYFGSPLGEVDQVAKVVAMLQGDPFTRQAVISIWDPAVDLGAKTKDMPCTNWLHFQVREVGGRRLLDLTVVMRSNDVLWGFSGVNVVNFTLLLELVAMLSGLDMGVYRHVSTNMHVYEKHLERMGPISAGPEIYGLMRGGGYPAFGGSGLMGEPVSLPVFTYECRKVLGMLESVRSAGPVKISSEVQWLSDWAYFMSLHTAYSAGGASAEWWAEALQEVRNGSWRIAAARAVAARDDRFAAILGEVLRPLLGHEGADTYLKAFHPQGRADAEG